jgi:hypothetical protein
LQWEEIALDRAGARRARRLSKREKVGDFVKTVLEHFPASIVGIFALIGIAAVAIWIVYVFFSEGIRSTAQKYYDLKLALSVEAAKAAAQIATSDDADTIRKAAFSI